GPAPAGGYADSPTRCRDDAAITPVILPPDADRAPTPAHRRKRSAAADTGRGQWPPAGAARRTNDPPIARVYRRSPARCTAPECPASAAQTGGLNSAD